MMVTNLFGNSWYMGISHFLPPLKSIPMYQLLFLNGVDMI